MAVIDSTLMAEVQAIIEDGSNPVHNRYRLTFLLDGLEYPANKLKELNIDRDYTAALADLAMAEVEVEEEIYLRYLYPNRERLMARLSKAPTIAPDDPEVDSLGGTLITLWRPVLQASADETLETNHPISSDPATQGQRGFRTLVVQLIHPAADHVRRKSLGGVFNRVSAGDLLKGLLTHTAASQVIEEPYRVKGVDMVPPDTKGPRETIVLPHGTPVTSLHKTLQRDQGGIYQTGIASYIQNDRWYVYPPFHLDRFDREPRTLTLINLPPNQAPMIENTYRIKDNAVIALLTDQTREIDDTEDQELNQGNGVVYLKASKVMEGIIATKGNRTTTQRDQNIRQYGLRERQTRENYQVISPERITDNDAVQASRLARRNGRHMLATWHNANPDVLYPGMPVRFLSLKSDNLTLSSELFGTLVRADHQILMKGRGQAMNHHACISVLTLFLGRPTKDKG